MGADYPNKKLSVKQGNNGLTGVVVDSNVEGRASEKDTIRSGTKGKKGACYVGASNPNSA